MKKLFTAIVLVLLTVVSVSAAPFLTCTPYTKDGAEPVTFTVVLNGTSYESPAVATGTNQVYLHFDLAGKFTAGANTSSIIARNVYGASASVPFDFKAGVPALPSGIGISAN